MTLFLSTLVLGTELSMYIAEYTSERGSHLIVLAIALWPTASGAILWVGMRMYLRSRALSQ